MTDTPDQEFWYRYEDQRWSVTIDAELERYGTRYDLRELKFKVVRRTPKGAWLKEVYGPLGLMESPELERWVALGEGKRYAYPSREKAYQGYIARKKREIKIHLGRADAAKIFLEIARERLEHEVFQYD